SGNGRPTAHARVGTDDGRRACLSGARLVDVDLSGICDFLGGDRIQFSGRWLASRAGPPHEGKVSMFELIKTLTELPGMIGQEDSVQEFIRQSWSASCQLVQTSAVGNVMARVGGQGPRLLIEAHADEIGVLVKGIEARGYVWVAPKNDKA